MTLSGPAVEDRAWLWPLLVTLLMQTVAAFRVRALAGMGPSGTRAAGVSPEQSGHLAGLTAAGTMGFVALGVLVLKWFGPVRTLQLGALLGAAGLRAVASAHWPVMLRAALAIGVGYGPSPPAGSDSLGRSAPPGRRARVFSIKQSGVPLGGVLAGLVLPPAVAAFGGRWALGLGALISLATAAIVQPLRAPLDGHHAPAQTLSLGTLCSRANLQAPCTVLREAPDLGPLTVTGFAFAGVPGCFLPFLVTDLVAEVGFSLAAAGVVFSATPLAGFLARVAMGWVAAWRGARGGRCGRLRGHALDWGLSGRDRSPGAPSQRQRGHRGVHFLRVPCLLRRPGPVRDRGLGGRQLPGLRRRGRADPLGTDSGPAAPGPEGPEVRNGGSPTPPAAGLQVRIPYTAGGPIAAPWLCARS